MANKNPNDNPDHKLKHTFINYPTYSCYALKGYCIVIYDFSNYRYNMMANNTLALYNQRIRDAANISTENIEKFIPVSLLKELKLLGQSISSPWLGILLGLLAPVQYSMKFAHVEIEKTSWREPTILWTIQHMSSGTCKIFNLVNDVVNHLESNCAGFKANEITFEKMGIKMQENKSSLFWYFDELRLFFSQLGMYQKGSGCRDESVLLTLYDGGEWSHSTTQGAQFDMKHTKLVLGGDDTNIPLHKTDTK